MPKHSAAPSACPRQAGAAAAGTSPRRPTGAGAGGGSAARRSPGRPAPLRSVALTQGQFAQRQQLALAHEAARRALALRTEADPALLQAQQQLVRRQVDHDDLVGLVEHAVGHRFVDARARDATDHVVQAVQVLDIHRRPYRDAGVAQGLDVLPALRMPGTRGVRAGELVDEHERRTAREHGSEVEFGTGCAPGTRPCAAR
jgi:hypothetical protein